MEFGMHHCCYRHFSLLPLLDCDYLRQAIGDRHFNIIRYEYTFLVQ